MAPKRIILDHDEQEVEAYKSKTSLPGIPEGTLGWKVLFWNDSVQAADDDTDYELDEYRCIHRFFPARRKLIREAKTMGFEEYLRQYFDIDESYNRWELKSEEAYYNVAGVGQTQMNMEDDSDVDGVEGEDVQMTYAEHATQLIDDLAEEEEWMDEYDTLEYETGDKEKLDDWMEQNSKKQRNANAKRLEAEHSQEMQAMRLKMAMMEQELKKKQQQLELTEAKINKQQWISVAEEQGVDKDPNMQAMNQF